MSLLENKHQGPVSIAEAQSASFSCPCGVHTTIASHIMLHLLQGQGICNHFTANHSCNDWILINFWWTKDTSIACHSTPRHKKDIKGLISIWLHLFHKDPFRSRSGTTYYGRTVEDTINAVVLDLFGLQTSHAWGRKRKFPILTTTPRISTASVNLNFQLQQNLTFHALRTLTASWVSPKELALPRSWSVEMTPHPQQNMGMLDSVLKIWCPKILWLSKVTL